MRRGGNGITVILSAVVLVLSALASSAQAHVILNWDKSGRSWNNTHMTKIKAAMEAAGHTVLPDSPITENSLKGVSAIVFAEPTAVPTADELVLTRKFVNAGGVLLIFGDTGIELPTYNGLLTGVGSSIAFTTTTIGTTSALPDNRFTDAPNRIVGSTLSVTSGNGTTGGTLIDNNYARYDVVGAGLIFVFGDRIDHNDVISSTNTNLLLNIVAIAIGPALLIPTLSPAGLALLSVLLLLVFAWISRTGRILSRETKA